jgi:hypothetical protein
MEAGASIMKLARSGEIVERAMIVMTDGLHNTGPAPEIVATALAKQGIVIHTISFGADADVVRMQKMAQIGNGKAFQASDGKELKKVFRELALTLSTVITE